MPSPLPTRAYDFAAGQRPAVSGTSNRITLARTPEVLLTANTRCFVRLGDSTVTATAGAGSIPIENGEKFHLQLNGATHLAVIQDTAAGFLTVVPCDSV